jgi:hypothetical protein
MPDYGTTNFGLSEVAGYKVKLDGVIMSCEALTLFLPVIWALVGTAIGLLLYKSSSALYQGKGLRLTGSVVIAALAFYGMLRATPSGRLAGPQEGMSMVHSNTLDAAREMTKGLDRKVLELQACAATLADQSCQKQLLDLKVESSALANFVSENLSTKKD